MHVWRRRGRYCTEIMCSIVQPLYFSCTNLRAACEGANGANHTSTWPSSGNSRTRPGAHATRGAPKDRSEHGCYCSDQDLNRMLSSLSQSYSAPCHWAPAAFRPPPGLPEPPGLPAPEWQ